MQTVVSANGIDPAFFVDGPNHPKRFIYASHPFYGLATLLEVRPFWTHIQDISITNIQEIVSKTGRSTPLLRPRHAPRGLGVTWLCDTGVLFFLA